MLAALLFVFLLLQLVDYELTAGILARGGRELNPLVRWLIGHMGAWSLRLSKLIAVSLGYVLMLHGEMAMLVIVCALYLALAAWNWHHLRTLK